MINSTTPTKQFLLEREGGVGEFHTITNTKLNFLYIPPVLLGVVLTPLTYHPRSDALIMLVISLWFYILFDF